MNKYRRRSAAHTSPITPTENQGILNDAPILCAMERVKSGRLKGATEDKMKLYKHADIAARNKVTSLIILELQKPNRGTLLLKGIYNNIINYIRTNHNLLLSFDAHPNTIRQRILRDSTFVICRSTISHLKESNRHSSPVSYKYAVSANPLLQLRVWTYE